jgi:hypothetical protein
VFHILIYNKITKFNLGVKNSKALIQGYHCFFKLFYVISESVTGGIVIYHFIIIILVEKVVDIRKVSCILDGACVVSWQLKLCFCHVILFFIMSSFIIGDSCDLKIVGLSPVTFFFFFSFISLSYP